MKHENKNTFEEGVTSTDVTGGYTSAKKAYIRPHTQIIDFEDIVVCSGGCTAGCVGSVLYSGANGNLCENEQIINEEYKAVGQ